MGERRGGRDWERIARAFATGCGGDGFGASSSTQQSSCENRVHLYSGFKLVELIFLAHNSTATKDRHSLSDPLAFKDNNLVTNDSLTFFSQLN